MERVLLIFVILFAITATGYTIGKRQGENDCREQMADLQTKHLKAIADLQAQRESERREWEKEKADALEEREKAYSAIADIERSNTDLVERLRRSTEAGSGSSASRVGAGSKADTSGTCKRQIKTCRLLLAEGARLAQEGSRMVGEFSADRDAVRRLQRHSD